MNSLQIYPISDFVGRKKEQEKIIDWINPNHSKRGIITIMGIGGIGKTELAKKIAFSVKEMKLFKFIVWVTAKDSWLTVNGIVSKKHNIPLTLSQLLNKIIETGNLSPDLMTNKESFKREIVKDFLSKNDVLLIIDNLETVDDISVLKFIDEIGNSNVRTKVLITTRLTSQTNSGVPVAPQIQGESKLKLEPLTENEAIELFLLRANEKGLQFKKENHSKLIKKIINQVSRIPLAIEWLVSILAIKKYNIEDAIHEFKIIDNDVLTFCFGNLLGALSPKARRVLKIIPIFYKSVSISVLSKISGIATDKIREIVNELVSASLIDLDAEDITDPRYFIHSPTKLIVEQLWKRDYEFYYQHHLKSIKFYKEFLVKNIPLENWTKIGIEYDNIFHLFNWSYENHKYSYVIALANGMKDYLNRVGLWDERAKVGERTMKAAKTIGNDKAFANFSYDVGLVQKQRGNLEEALTVFNQIIRTISHENPNDILNGLSLLQIAIIKSHLGSVEESNQFLFEASNFFLDHNKPKEEARTYSIIGRNLLKQKNFKEAEKYLKKSFKIKSDLNSKLSLAIGLYDLGYCYFLKGDFNQSENNYKKSLSILDQIGEKRHKSNLLWYYSKLKESKGEIETARVYLNQVIRIEKELQRDRHYNRALVLLNKLNQNKEEIKSEHVKENYLNCQCSECVISESPYKFKITDIQKRIDKGNKSIMCMKSFEDINIGIILNIQDSLNSDSKVRINKLLKHEGGNKIFISYSHKDKIWLDKLKVHLKVLENEGIDIEAWDDTVIKIGDKWRSQIEKSLEEARIAILLISADFLASSFIREVELPSILNSAVNKGVFVFPLILKYTRFNELENLSSFQAVNSPKEPLYSISDQEQDKIFIALTKRIAEIFKN